MDSSELGSSKDKTYTDQDESESYDQHGTLDDSCDAPAPDDARRRRASQRPRTGLIQRTLSYFNSQRDLTDIEVSQIHDAVANIGGAGGPLLPAGPRVRRPTTIQKQVMNHAKVPEDQLSQVRLMICTLLYIQYTPSPGLAHSPLGCSSVLTFSAFGRNELFQEGNRVVLQVFCIHGIRFQRLLRRERGI
jgi:hypothetical protein